MDKFSFILVNSKILPPVFKGVLQAKELLEKGEATNISQAVKMAGISRSVFYKYRDYVFKYADGKSDIINLSATLSDKAGVLSAMTTVLSESGANIITVNQGVPVNGSAAVTFTVKIDTTITSPNDLLLKLKSVNGVVSIKTV